MLHLLNNGPVASEYVVSGTTYAPEGFIFDSLGAQVFFVIVVPVDFQSLILKHKYFVCFDCKNCSCVSRAMIGAYL